MLNLAGTNPILDQVGSNPGKKLCQRVVMAHLSLRLHVTVRQTMGVVLIAPAAMCPTAAVATSHCIYSAALAIQDNFLLIAAGKIAALQFGDGRANVEFLHPAGAGFFQF